MKKFKTAFIFAAFFLCISGHASVISELASQVERVRERMSLRLAPDDPSGLFRKILLNRDPVNPLPPVLRLLGFVHLYSPAGIHIYCLFTWIEWICVGCFERLRVRPRVARRFSWSISFAFAIWAWLLQGGRPGMLRPLVVVLLRSLSRRLGWTWKWWAPLALSLLLNIHGKMHYALAVGGGLAALEAIRERRRSSSHWKEHLALSLGSWIFCAFFDGFQDQMFSLATPLLNLICYPLFSLILYPLLIFDGVLGGALPISTFLSVTESFLQHLTEILVLTPSLWRISFLGMLLGLALAIVGFQNRKLFLHSLIAAFLLRIILAQIEAVPRVTQLNVGQGDAALVQMRRENLLIDVGSQRALDEAKWLKNLARLSAGRIHGVLLSHLDEDHFGGIQRLAHIASIGAVYLSEDQWRSDRGKKLLEYLEEKHIPFRDISSARLPFRVFPAGEDQSEDVSRERNSTSTAFAVKLGEHSVYFSLGDADSQREISAAQELIREFPIHAFSRRILKVSHHGSRFSTSREFLEILRPSEAWISVGRRNHYGHPTRATLNRLIFQGVFVRRTDLEGSLSSND